MRSENVAKNRPKCCQIANIWRSQEEIVVTEDNHDKIFTVPFKAEVILCMRRWLYVVFKTVPYTILADNSIYLNCRAIRVV